MKSVRVARSYGVEVNAWGNVISTRIFDRRMSDHVGPLSETVPKLESTLYGGNGPDHY